MDMTWARVFFTVCVFVSFVTVLLIAFNRRNKVNPDQIVAHMKGLQTLGTPYTDEEIAKAPEMLKDKSELDAVIAYLQGLGLALKNVR